MHIHKTHQIRKIPTKVDTKKTKEKLLEIFLQYFRKFTQFRGNSWKQKIEARRKSIYKKNILKLSNYNSQIAKDLHKI